MTSQGGFRQVAAASFRRGSERFRRFAATASVVSAEINAVKSIAGETLSLSGVEKAATEPAFQMLDIARAATAIPGDLVNIADAMRDKQDDGWPSRAAAGAAASHSLLTDLGKVTGGISLATTALGVAPALPFVAAGLTIAGAGAAVWKARQDQKVVQATQPRGSVGGSMVKQLRQQLSQLDLQLDQLSTNLGQQQEHLRKRGQHLSELIGGSAAERSALEKLSESIKALRRSRSAVTEAKGAIGKLQL